MIKRITPLLLFIGLAFAQDVTIAVFDFENNGLKPHEVRQLSTRLESELVKNGGFKVVERSKIDEILKEQKLQMSGIIDKKYLIDIGEMLGAELIVLGSVGEFGGLYTITARLVDIESGQITKSADYDTENGLSQLFKDGLGYVASELTGTEKTRKANIKLDNTKGGKQYIVLLDKIFIDENDFSYKNGDLFGIKTAVTIGLFQDDKIIWRVDTRKKGGLVEINKTKIFKFNPYTTYSILISEGILTDGNGKLLTFLLTGNSYWINSEQGEWIFDKGKLSFGKNSYIEVSQVLKN